MIFVISRTFYHFFNVFCTANVHHSQIFMILIKDKNKNTLAHKFFIFCFFFLTNNSLQGSKSWFFCIFYRDDTCVDDLMEKQAEMIRYLKERNAALGKQVLELTSQANTVNWMDGLLCVIHCWKIPQSVFICKYKMFQLEENTMIVFHGLKFGS